MKGRAVAALAFAAASLVARVAEATTPEPWSDMDPPSPPSRIGVGEASGVRAAAEYRANALLVGPVSTSEHDRSVESIEHRVRLDGMIDWQDRVRAAISVDVFDGVLWGDNGGPGSSARTTAGANVLALNPNVATTCIRAREGYGLTTPDAYAIVPCDASPLFVRRVYGEAVLPFGLVRVGRQAYDDGTGVLVADGDGRRNRFGFARRGDSVDRVLFATKALEVFAPPDERDPSEDRGLFLVLAYDRVATSAPEVLGDDAHDWVTALRLVAPTFRALRDVEARLFHAYRWQTSTDTSLHAGGGRISYRFGDVYTGVDAAFVAGGTRALAEANRVVAREPIAVKQDVRAVGARAAASWDVLRWLSPYLELDYASGESTPGPRASISRFAFAADTNVGLLLFEQVLAYQSARAAAADAALVRSLGGDEAAARAAGAVATNGAFTNALAVFPQIDVRPVDDLLFRAGALFAWAQSPVVDPIRSLDARTRNLSDPDVNLAGGRPSRAYGTELDARVQWRYVDHFVFDLEGAALFPGAALADASGGAPRAAMVQARGTIFF